MTGGGRSVPVAVRDADLALAAGNSPLEILSWYDGPAVPDPITFVIGGEWLDKPNIYPRQVTILKLIFLRDDLFTDYDRAVIDEWIADFHRTNPDAGLDNKFAAETNGCQPDIYQRIAFLKERGYRWFPEVLMAIGRRGSKGYTCALAMAYVLWCYLSTGNPQEHYGISQEKALACMIFAGKKEAAKMNLWGDLYAVITTAPCFTPYISEALAETLSVYAPYDFVRIRQLAARGIRSAKDMASFQILPRESTLIAPRGPAGFIIGFDEAAHVRSTGTTRAFGDVYGRCPAGPRPVRQGRLRGAAVVHLGDAGPLLRAVAAVPGAGARQVGRAWRRLTRTSSCCSCRPGGRTRTGSRRTCCRSSRRASRATSASTPAPRCRCCSR